MTVAGIDRSVRLDIPPETPNGRVFRLRRLGMPNIKTPEKRGDLLVITEAILPKNLTDKEKELATQWKNAR